MSFNPKPALLLTALLALAAPALAQPTYQDTRYKTELATGAPPEGAPIPANVPRGPGSLTGVWYNADLSQTLTDHDPVRTAEGDPVPLQTWALKIMVTRAAEEEAGRPYADSSSRCLPLGVPQMMLEPRISGIDISESPRAVTMLFEEFNHWRQVRVGAAHDPEAPATYMGDSVGRWDGDSFVVETVNIDTAQDVEGFPHTDKLKVTERFRRISADRLEIKATIEDPGTFNRPWSLPRRTLTLKPGGYLEEVLCANQRNAPDANGNTGVQKPGAAAAKKKTRKKAAG